MTIQTLIIDDEPLARQRIRDLLVNEKEIDVAGESGNGVEAVAMIHDKKPDLIFLDVQMPEMDGFQVVENIKPEMMPHIIFVTAYDQYALRAFEVHALDYLLKPFDQDRFQKALDRAKKQIEFQKDGDFSYRLKELLHEIKSDDTYLERLIIKSEGRIFFVKTDEIDWIEAAGNYVTLHVGNEEHLMRDTMNSMEKKLDPKKFFRVHRSKIVNFECIKEIKPWFNGEYLIVLNDDSQLTLSRKYRERLKDFF